VKSQVIHELNYVRRQEDVEESGGINPRFLNLGIWWSLVVSFTTRPNYPRGKSPQYPIRRLGGTHSRSTSCEEDGNLLSQPGTQPWFLGRPACTLVTILTELFWLFETEVLVQNPIFPKFLLNCKWVRGLNYHPWELEHWDPARELKPVHRCVSPPSLCSAVLCM
jgi:hypothetical protein